MFPDKEAIALISSLSSSSPSLMINIQPHSQENETSRNGKHQQLLMSEIGPRGSGLEFGNLGAVGKAPT